MQSIAVEEMSQVAQARRTAVQVAESLGFDEAAAGRVAIVATELATNLLKHGGGGEILVGAYDTENGAASGVECLALDRGPGMSDVPEAMGDGFSSVGTQGTGLGAIARQSEVMDVYSRPGAGTVVLARLCRAAPKPGRRHPLPAYGAVSVPVPGEEACGDQWSVRQDDDAVTLMVVDGLGHGPIAATAAHEAVKVFAASRLPPSAELAERIHQALRSTRGAAASIARIAPGEDITFIGVGNVAGAIVGTGEMRRMVTYNGTLGHTLKAARPFSYPAPADALIILASDGLGTSWTLDAYPGLSTRHPSLIAAVLYRDFSRRRDDVTVLVARREAA